jgi:hypothetical protein|tara:strand:- start:201 stop:503 length:303 start_codon:yes stop_codon:yes gene_type:complete
MPGFFEALSGRKRPDEKKHFVEVQGKQHEVTLEKKLWAIKQEKENLIMKNGEITLKPAIKLTTSYPVLVKADKGYQFEQDDIHWPNKIVEGGMTWLIERE